MKWYFIEVASKFKIEEVFKMRRLPVDIKLTLHAQQRLLERKGIEKYNIENLMQSPVKWYGKDDLIPQSNLYIHCLYVCRKSNQMGYITDGNIEVIYNRSTGVAITILEVKDKFKPISQFLKDDKRENKEVNNEDNEIINIREEIITYYKLYTSLIGEKLSKKENQDIEMKRNLKHNIVYREKIKKPMTISELYGLE